MTHPSPGDCVFVHLKSFDGMRPQQRLIKLRLPTGENNKIRLFFQSFFACYQTILFWFWCHLIRSHQLGFFINYLALMRENCVR